MDNVSLFTIITPSIEVPFLRIGDISEVGTGSSNGNEADENGDYPFFVRSQSVKRKNTFEYDEEAVIIPGEGGIGDIYHYVNGKYAIHQRVYRIHFTSPDINTKFAYHYFSGFFKEHILKKAVSATVVSIRKPMIEDFKIPIPPLEVQNEIVRILDGFTSLTAELTAELTARKQQYEFYRDKLLSLRHLISITPVETYSIDELCYVVTDGSHFSPQSMDGGYYMPSVKDMRVEGFDYSSCKQISENDYNSLVKNGCKPQIGDVLVAKDGSMLKYVFSVKEEKEIVLLSSIAILRPKTDIVVPDYLVHYLRQNQFREQIIREYSTVGGVPRIVLKNFKKISMKIPPLDVQKEIVRILNQFSALCNDLTCGIPAEIEARRKQYEYYREKLLSFEKAEIS